MEYDYANMGYDEFVEILDEIGDNSETEIHFFPEPEMVKAVLGITEVNDTLYLVYSYQKIIDVLIQRDKMEEMEAIEFFDYNIERTVNYANLNILFVR